MLIRVPKRVSDADQRRVFQKRRKSLRRFFIVVQRTLRGHISHTTLSSSLSRALGTIHFGNPMPLPLLP